MAVKRENSKSKEVYSEKWLLTLNNPQEHGYTHEYIRDQMEKLKVTYYVLGDEEGALTHTYHTHLYFKREGSVIRFSTLKSLFPEAHIQRANGTSSENRAYVLKIGKHKKKGKDENNPEQADIHFSDTDEEYGECPIERQGYRTDLNDIYEMIKSGMSDAEILEADPTIMIHLERLDKVRQTFLEEKYKNMFRKMHVTYIYGKTASGKTRSVMEKYKDDNGNPIYDMIYRVTNYEHPFDFYHGEKVILFEEFRSSLRIENMLNYLDGYPLKLPARFSDRQACYDEVYICTNIPLEKQYPKVQENEPVTYKAFCRRIHDIINMDADENGFMKLDDNEQFEFEDIFNV